MRHILILILLLIYFVPRAQNNFADSIRDQLQNAGSDTAKIRLLIRLSDKLSDNDPAQGKIYGLQALELSRSHDMPKQAAQAALNLGNNYFKLNTPDSALYYLREVQQIVRAHHFNNMLFRLYNLMGAAFNDIPDFDSTMHYLTMARQLAVQAKDSLKMAAVYVNIGSLLNDQGRLEDSFDNYTLAARIYKNLHQDKNYAVALNNLALINIDLKNYPNAIRNLEQAIDLNKKNNNRVDLSMAYCNLGICYKEKGDYQKAAYYYHKSISIAEDLGLKFDLARNYHNLGNIYLKLKDFDEARLNYNKSLEYSNELRLPLGAIYNGIALADLDIQMGNYASAKVQLDAIYPQITGLGLVKLQEETLDLYIRLMDHLGNYQRAFRYQHEYMTLKDSLDELANKQQVEALQAKYEARQREAENQKLKALNQYHAKVIQNQRIIGLGILIVLGIASLLALTFFRSRQKLKRTFAMLKKLNARIVDQNKELESLNQTKDRLFGLIAHDLRGPFNTLSGFLDLLLESYDQYNDTQKKEILEMVQEQSNNTYGLLENLLQWSMSQQGKIKVSPGFHNLNDIICSQIDFLLPRARRKNIRIYTDLPDQMHVVVDETMMKTVFRNIINNAIKFSHRGGSIYISGQFSVEKMQIAVRDQGVGISEAQRSQLFGGKNIRPTPGTDQEKGAGLGLEIVRDFLDKNKASIAVESTPGEGTTFIIKIPYREIPVAAAN